VKQNFDPIEKNAQNDKYNFLGRILEFSLPNSLPCPDFTITCNTRYETIQAQNTTYDIILYIVYYESQSDC
jgi:hypothetical protein